MLRKHLSSGVLSIVLIGPCLLAQSTGSAPVSSMGLEFPVVLRQKIEAGKTAPGTKIQAKLMVATLVSGTVIPQDAMLMGEVIESTARSNDTLSQLSVKIESAEWKDGVSRKSLALPPKIYLTAWYYPLELMPQEPSDTASSGSINIGQRRGGSAPYPDPNTLDSPAYSRGNTDPRNNPIPDKPSSRISAHREPLKNLETVIDADGGVTLTSSRSNIKLDKSTTYVFAPGNLSSKP